MPSAWCEAVFCFVMEVVNCCWDNMTPLNVTSVCIQEKRIPLQKFRNKSFAAAIHQIFLMELVAAHHNDIPHIFQQFSFSGARKMGADRIFFHTAVLFSCLYISNLCECEAIFQGRLGGVTYQCEPGLLVQKLPHQSAIA